jgi:protein-S-isoprenylcysteine O-methyltransferase Ste14
MSVKHHHDRDDLVGEHAAGDVGQIVCAILFAVIWIADTFFFKYTTLLNNYVPLTIRRVIGIAFLIIAGYLAKTGLSIVFGEERREPGVIRKGVFGVVRHPVYLSEILLYFGLFMLSMSLASAVVLVIAFIFLHYISRYEEGLLIEHFGEEYEQYMREVPMWIPRPWKR